MSQVKLARSSNPPFPTMDLEYNDYLHYNQANLLHLQQGPISAPAAPSSGDDYFTFVVPHDEVSQDYTLSSNHEHADTGSLAQSQLRVNQWKPQPGATSKNLGHMSSRQRTFSDKKARHKSRLSNSINYNAEDSRAVSDLPPVLDNSSETSNREGLLKNKKKNPGFHIALDNLQAPNMMLRIKDQNLQPASVGSDSRVDLTYQQMKISDPDVLFHKNGVEWDSGQENVTPLMNPPNTNDLGYFGSFDIHLAENDGSFTLSDGGMPAGYLSLPKDVDRASVTKSDSTDFDDLAQIPLEGFVPVPESFEDYNHGIPHFDDNYVDQTFGHTVSLDALHHNINHNQHQFDHREYPALRQQHLHSHQHHQHLHQQPHNQHQHSHGHDYPLDHSQQSGMHGAHAYNHGMPMNFQEQYRPVNKAPVAQAQSLFPDRPVLERSQSALSAMTSTKSDIKKKKKSSRVVICPICDKHISRDFTRHSRIHNEIGRFQCVFPRSECSHKSGKFNRPYDYKKHLLNVHFTFEDPKTRLAPNLKEKLMVRGHCNACGQHFTGNDWLNEHVLNTDKSKRCSKLQQEAEFDEDDFQSGENGEDDQANMADFLKEESLD